MCDDSILIQISARSFHVPSSLRVDNVILLLLPFYSPCCTALPLSTCCINWKSVQTSPKADNMSVRNERKPSEDNNKKIINSNKKPRDKSQLHLQRKYYHIHSFIGFPAHLDASNYETHSQFSYKRKECVERAYGLLWMSLPLYTHAHTHT